MSSGVPEGVRNLEKTKILYLWRFTDVWPKYVTGGRRKCTLDFYFDIVAGMPFLLKQAFLWCYL